jgi:hypothetical protein
LKHFADDLSHCFESPAGSAHSSGDNPKDSADDSRKENHRDGPRGHEANASDSADASRFGAEKETKEEIEGKEVTRSAFVPYQIAMDELFVHLEAQKLPKVVHSLLGTVLDNPTKLLCVIGNPSPALGASHIATGFYASNLLKKLIEAVRALDWELVTILLEHALLPGTKETKNLPPAIVSTIEKIVDGWWSGTDSEHALKTFVIDQLELEGFSIAQIDR